MSIQTINPATEEIIETFEAYTPTQLDEALSQARQAFEQWRERPRHQTLHAVGEFKLANPLVNDATASYTLDSGAALAPTMFLV